MACFFIASGLVCMIARIKKYVREIFLEWEKASKPDWKQVKANTLVVVVATLILGIYIALVDGNKDFPVWVTSDVIFGPGLILLFVFLIAPLSWFARRFTSRWEILIPISIAPLLITLALHYIVMPSDPVSGFGSSWIRELFMK